MPQRPIQIEENYTLPKKNVLVLGCIDLRLTDETVAFLHADNLHNRFDYFTLAGASLCTQASVFRKDFKKEVLTKFKDFTHWRQTLLEHVQSAIDLHQIADVYIIEHRDCGAYKVMLNKGEFGPGQEHKEETAHQKYATELAKELEKLETKFLDNGKIVTKHLNVHAFLIDLRGDVKLIYPSK